MLEGLKRLFSGTGTAPASEWEGVAPWAASRQFLFRGVHAPWCSAGTMARPYRGMIV